MTDEAFKQLMRKIKQKMDELSFLQELYIKETGVSHIPGLLAGTLKENIKD